MNDAYRALIQLSGKELDNAIEQYNLFKEQVPELPDGEYKARFIGMYRPFPGWHDSKTTRCYFAHILKDKLILSGFFGNLRPGVSKLQGNLHIALTGQRQSGYLSFSSYNEYQGRLVCVGIAWTRAKKSGDYYPKVTAIPM